MSLLVFFLILIFREPISERLGIFLHSGYEKKNERKDRINIARNVVSMRKTNATALSGDLTDKNGYLAIRRHLSGDALEIIERENGNYNTYDPDSDFYFFAKEVRLNTLAKELDRLSKEWGLPV